MKKKGLVIAASVMLILCLAVGGTLAWLMDNSGPVTNTFTYGKVDIELTEEAGKLVGEKHEFKMVPGNTIEKDPLVTVKANSEACWLFVEVEETDNFDEFMTYAIAAGWNPYDFELVDGKIDTVAQDSYVIYRQVAASTVDQTFAVLADDQVKVNDDVTKEMFAALTSNPELTFTAYAVQQDNLTVEKAWDVAK